MKIAYFDCFSGASGDMILGSLGDAGLSPRLLREEIKKASGDYIDLKAYEPGMRQLIDMYIAADPCRKISAFDDIGIPTAMESGKRAAQAALDGADPIEEILIPGMR